MTEITLLLVFGVVALFIGANAKARDVARATSRRECQRRHLVFLDDSIAMKSLKIRKYNGRFGFYRSYAFEYNHSDYQRYNGKVELFGYMVLSLQFFHPDHIEQQVNE